MTTKKQTKAQERKRYEQLQRKIAERRVRRQRNWKIAGITALVIAAGALVYAVVNAAMGDDASAPAPVVTPEPTASSPSQDPTTPEPGPTASDDWASSPVAPSPALAEDRTWSVVVDTNQGVIEMELDGASAPQAVASFVALAGQGFFDATECHRLVNGGIFVLQCGDPTGTGTGGPAYRYGPIENAPADDLYPTGTLAMARVGGNGESMGSQFFIVYDDSRIPSDGAGGYTVFGVVTSGLAIVEQIAQAGTDSGGTDGRPAQPVIINEVSVS
ncbi:MAG: peptidylprolyl isomerase [Actinobacteria bacterium HGW-Actinobacteria-4]|nr:MAG: peptidylprolyl isomerase [Actinobacteria bacterium HGW-Actinobacteria-4]